MNMGQQFQQQGQQLMNQGQQLSQQFAGKLRRQRNVYSRGFMFFFIKGRTSLIIQKSIICSMFDIFFAIYARSISNKPGAILRITVVLNCW